VQSGYALRYVPVINDGRSKVPKNGAPKRLGNEDGTVQSERDREESAPVKKLREYSRREISERDFFSTCSSERVLFLQ